MKKIVSDEIDLHNLQPLTDEEDAKPGSPFQKPSSGVDLPPLDEEFMKRNFTPIPLTNQLLHTNPFMFNFCDQLFDFEVGARRLKKQ